MALSACELGELADLNLAESLREHARWSAAGAIDEHDGTLRVLSNTRFAPGVFNTVIRTHGELADANAWLAEQRAFFSRRGRGFSVYTRGERERELAQACRRAGFEAGDELPVMACDHPPSERAVDPRVRVQRVTTAEALAHVTDVEARAYTTIGLPETVLRKVMGEPARLLRPNTLWLLASWNGEPAAAALAILSHSIGGLYWVATAPAYRGRGLGEACTRAATRAAFEHGARAVILQASRMGEPIYCRLGFREIARYPWYWTPRVGSERASASVAGSRTSKQLPTSEGK